VIIKYLVKESDMKNSLNQFIKNHLYHLPKNKINTEDAKIIYAYRYLSWALTSFVYLTGNPNSVFIFKFGVILSLFVSSFIFTDLYMKYKESTKTLKILLLSETLGITFLLLPTNGLSSPFIWYALNPTLVAANYLPAYFCWFNLVFFLLTGSIMTYFIFNPNHISLLSVLAKNYNLTLAFVLITLVVQLLANLTNKLSLQTNALKLSNQQRQESMNYIMSLYQIMEAVDKHITKDKLLDTLAEYTSSLMNSKLCIYWLPGSPGDVEIIQVNKSCNSIELQKLLSD
jgi:NarL family two-component system sensor histidine kinase LiaS